MISETWPLITLRWHHQNQLTKIRFPFPVSTNRFPVAFTCKMPISKWGRKILFFFKIKAKRLQAGHSSNFGWNKYWTNNNNGKQTNAQRSGLRRPPAASPPPPSAKSCKAPPRCLFTPCPQPPGRPTQTSHQVAIGGQPKEYINKQWVNINIKKKKHHMDA